MGLNELKLSPITVWAKAKIKWNDLDIIYVKKLFIFHPKTDAGIPVLSIQSQEGIPLIEASTGIGEAE